MTMYDKLVSDPLGALLVTLVGLVLTVWFINLPSRLVRKENTSVVKEKPSDHCEKKNSFKEVAKKKQEQQDKHVNKVKKLSVEGTKGTGLELKILQQQQEQHQLLLLLQKQQQEQHQHLLLRQKISVEATKGTGLELKILQQQQQEQHQLLLLLQQQQQEQHQLLLLLQQQQQEQHQLLLLRQKISVEATKGTGLDPKIPQVSAAVAAAAASAAARRSNMFTQQTGED